jgi:hypothetical protein
MAATQSLAFYLRGHYAGSAAAVRSVRAQARRDPDGALGRTLADLGREIAEDQATLGDVMARLGVAPGRVRNRVASAAALLGRWAVRVLAPGESQRSLIGVESLSLGIAGKASLWRALQAIADEDARLSHIDFDALLRRADQQRDQLAPHQLSAARHASGNGGGNGKPSRPTA